VKISRKHDASELEGPQAFENKVQVFYEQTFGWQLHIADLLANGGVPYGSEERVSKIEHSGFAVLHICLSYFELIGTILSAPGVAPSLAFRAGVDAVIPTVVPPGNLRKEFMRKLHHGVRCGLYHQGRTRAGVGLGQPEGGDCLAFDPSTGIIAISPERLPGALITHLRTFCDELLTSASPRLRENFERLFNSGFDNRAPDR
jgi:hypothetical protein